MRAIDFLKQKGFDVEPDIHTNLQRELHFTGNEIAYLMESYAMQVNGVSTSHDKALNLADVSNNEVAVCSHPGMLKGGTEPFYCWKCRKTIYPKQTDC